MPITVAKMATAITAVTGSTTSSATSMIANNVSSDTMVIADPRTAIVAAATPLPSA